MSANIFPCPIWGDGYPAEGYREHQNRTFYVDDSPRAAGRYILPEVTQHAQVDKLSSEQKARLTTWLVNQRKQGNQQPTITKQVIDYVKDGPALKANDRAVRLLEFIAKSSANIGMEVEVSYGTHGAFAHSESTSWDEINFLIRYLERMGWIGCQQFISSMIICTVTVDGYNEMAERATNLDSSQAFVAMWFDQSMKASFELGIQPAVQEAGYKPLRIDQKEHIDKIDDQIIAEIRRSRFVIADFTHDNQEPRGGVYYEAGFAHGLNIPVIFTCRKDCFRNLHFDTNHFNHIVWSTPEELREKLKSRILAVIGEGPEGDKKA